MTTVSEAIKKRHSARAFLDKDVDIEHLGLEAQEEGGEESVKEER